MTDSKKQPPVRSKHTTTSLIIVAIIMIVVGVYITMQTRAATPFIVAQPEVGVLSAGSSKVTDSSASAGSAVKFAKPAVARTIRIMPLGDSITEGHGIAGAYRTKLWQKMVQTDGAAIDLVGSQTGGTTALGDKNHEGHGGWCIDGDCYGGAGSQTIYQQVDSWLTAANPDIVIIHAGTNDIGTGATGSVMTNRLDLLLSRVYARLPNASIVLAQNIGMNVSGGQLTTYNTYVNAMPGLVTKYQGQGRKISLVNLTGLLKYPADYADSWHPNQAGFDKMGEALYPAVTAAYKSY